jgi:hypothetical protein
MTQSTYAGLPIEAEWALSATQKTALALTECEGVISKPELALRSSYDPSHLATAREMALVMVETIDSAHSYSHMLAEARCGGEDR